MPAFHLRISGSRPCRLVAVATKYCASYLWLERYLIVLAAMVAYYLKAFRSILAARCFLCATFWTPLRRCQIPLIKDLLFLFCKQERFLALNADCFDVGHRNTSLIPSIDRFGKLYHTLSGRGADSVSTCERTVSPSVSRLYPPSRHETTRPSHTSSAHSITVRVIDR